MKNGEIKGLNELIKGIRKFGAEGEKRIEQVTEANAREIERNAKRMAPYDLGVLRQNIKALRITELQWKVLANALGNAPYSAYMEFGTGGLVEVPSELREIAIKFKGKGVKKIDIRPRPFLYPSLIAQRKVYLQDLENELKDLTKL